MIGIFGGTFNPVHIGHLQTAIEIANQLQLERVHMVLCANPPHRPAPAVSIQERFHMLQLATSNHKVLYADDIEINLPGPSYTVNTLKHFKKQHPNTAVTLIMGMDNFISLPQWYQWQELLQLSNIVVAARPGNHLLDDHPMQDTLVAHQCQSAAEFQQSNNGKIIIAAVTALDIAASNIRTAITSGKSVDFLLPAPVLEYIKNKKLYTQLT